MGIPSIISDHLIDTAFEHQIQKLLIDDNMSAEYRPEAASGRELAADVDALYVPEVQ